MHVLRLAALAAVIAAQASAASIGYASDGTSLYEVNLATAAILGTQTLSVGGLEGLAMTSTGVLYGGFYNSISNITSFGTIDPATGNVSLFSAGGPAGHVSFAFDDADDLFVFSQGSLIFSWDPTVGLFSQVDWACGLAGGRGLAFGPDSLAWYAYGSTLLETGAVGCGGSGSGSGTGSGSTGSTGSEGSTGSTGSGGGGLPVDGFTALATTSATFYGVLTNGGSIYLVSFDGSVFPLGGIPTLNTIGSLPAGVTSLAVSPASFDTPEPAALWIVGCGLAALALRRGLRRRA